MKQVPIMALVTLFAPSLQLNGMLMTWKLYQAKQDYANRGALLRRIHYAFIPVTGLHELFIFPARPLIHIQNFYEGFRGQTRPRKPGQPG